MSVVAASTLEPTSGGIKVWFPSYEKCEYVCGYFGKVLGVVQSVFSAAANSPSSLRRVRLIVRDIKLLSVIGIPFSLVAVHSSAKKMLSDLWAQDLEGAAMSLAGFALSVGGAIGAVGGFTMSFLQSMKLPPVRSIGTILQPLGFVLLGGSTALKVAHVVKSNLLYQKLDHKLFSEKNKDEIRRSLEKTLGGAAQNELIEALSLKPQTPESLAKIAALKEKQKAILFRSVPKGSIEHFEVILSILERENRDQITEKELQDVLWNLNKVRVVLKEEIALDSIAIGANFIVIAALIFFCTGGTGLLPYILMVASSSIQLALHCYNDNR